MDKDWTKWRESLEPREAEALNKAKKTSKLKLMATFGLGATVGTSITAFVAYKIFKGLLGGFFSA